MYARNNKIMDKLGIPVGAVVAIPTSILSGLAAIQGNNGNLGDLNSLDAALNLVKNASWPALTYGGVSLLSTQLVLSYLNGTYLIGSSKTVLNLIKKDINFLKSKIFCQRFEEERPTLLENAIFVWCFLTSLIFAQIGSETLAFLGEGGEVTGFSLNLAVYFATRFEGARRFFQYWIEPSDVSRDSLLPSQEKTRLKNTLVSIPAYLLAVASLFPVLVNFIPESVEGLQKLFHSQLGADQHYQNVASFALGIFAALPTGFFYCITIKDIGKEFLETASSSVDSIRQHHFGDLFWLVMMTLIAFSASYFTSIGFRLVGTTNIENGYLSYLGESIGSTMADALLASIILMFWSHLQHTVNDKFTQRSKHSTSSQRYGLFSDQTESKRLIKTDTPRQDADEEAPKPNTYVV